MKRALFIAGLVLLSALWLGPLPALTRHSFTAHMLLHMGVVAVAAPLLALGVAGTRYDPVRRWPVWFPAVPLSIAELVVVWGWHAPALHHAARHVAWGMAVEQACFFVAGLLVWLASVSGREERAGAGVAALLLTSMHMTLLGALLALTPRALYAHAGHEEDAMLTALEDQHLGGAVMLTIGGIAYLAGGLALTARLVRRKLVTSRV
ncbi:MAG TPA: cytochrome c oxidase assembly protein [Opitutaceae bacterium]